MGKFFLEKKSAVIAIVDVQERLAAVMDKKDRVVSNCLHLIEAAKLLDIPVLLTEQYPKGLGHTVGEIKAALSGHNPPAYNPPSYNPIEKLTFNCLKEPAFTEALGHLGKKKVVLAGMETHICVLQTALSLINAGYGVHVVRDAVTSRSEDNFVTGIEMMRNAGAVITCTETVLFQLLGKSGTKEFKIISERIK